MERIYTNKSWEYVVKNLDKLSRRKSCVSRFRIDYFAFVFGTSSGKEFLKKFFLNIIGFMSQLRYILIFQLGKTKTLDPKSKYIVHLLDSNSFLKTILPVCNMLIKNEVNPVFLCPANHYHRLAARLDPRITDTLYRYEQIKMHPNKLLVIMQMITAFVFSAFDCAWFMFQPVKKSFFTSFSFWRHSYIHHYSDRFWKNYFDSEKRMFMAAADQYLWEAAVFSNIQKTSSSSFVFQHGKLSDVYYPTSAKYFCTLGPIDSKKMVEEYHANPTEIREVGSPCFDQIFNHYQQNPVKDIINNKTIVFFAQPWYRVSVSSINNYVSVLNWFYKLSENKRLAEYKFILKLHPHDLASFYQNKPASVEIAHDNLLALIEKSIFSITVDSSSVFESAFCGIPSIQTIPPERDLFEDESSTGIAMKASSYEELENLGFKLLEDENYYQNAIRTSREALDLYFANLGHSLEVVKAMLELA